MTLRDLLTRHDLQAYLPAFEDQHVTLSDLPRLSDEHLRVDFCISSFIDRRRFKAMVAELEAGGTSRSVPTMGRPTTLDTRALPAPSKPTVQATTSYAYSSLLFGARSFALEADTLVVRKGSTTKRTVALDDVQGVSLVGGQAYYCKLEVRGQSFVWISYTFSTDYEAFLRQLHERLAKRPTRPRFRYGLRLLQVTEMLVFILVCAFGLTNLCAMFMDAPVWFRLSNALAVPLMAWLAWDKFTYTLPQLRPRDYTPDAIPAEAFPGRGVAPDP